MRSPFSEEHAAIICCRLQSDLLAPETISRGPIASLTISSCPMQSAHCAKDGSGIVMPLEILHNGISSTSTTGTVFSQLRFLPLVEGS
jgi:hypothetical protein